MPANKRVVLSFNAIRDDLTNIVLFSTSILLGFALAGSISRVLQIGWQPSMTIQVLLACVVWSVYIFRGHISVYIRANTLCACFFVAGATGIWSFGVAGSGTLLIVSCCIVTCFLLGVKMTAFYAVLGGMLLLSQVLLAYWGQLHFGIAMGDYLLSPATLLNNFITYCFLISIFIMLIVRFRKYLHTLIADQKNYLDKQYEQLSQTETILNVVINALPYGILWKDTNFRFMGANRYFLDDMHVQDFSEIKGKTDFELVPLDVAEPLHEQDKQVLEHGENKFAYEDKQKDRFGNTKYIEASRIRLTSQEGKVIGVLTAYSDITERKNVELQLREAKHVAEQASLAKSNFLANMSHEIRTPLNGVLGLLDLSLNTDLTPEQVKLLNKANLSAKTLLNIINDVLDISKIEAGQMSFEQVPFALNQILDHIQSQFTVLAQRKNIQFKLNYLGPHDLWMKGDPTRLLQILMNLCSNAVKFTEQGQVTLTCRTEEQGENVQVIFTVKDTGIGIAQDKMPELFNHFTQADSSITRQYGGTGLGLSIVKALVELMGGEIRMNSQLQQGSQFVVQLCFVKSAMTEQQKQQNRFVDLTGSHILLVEDNAINQLIASQMLTEAGAIVICADDGKMALQFLAEQQFDLVLMDIQMPNMDGCTAIQHIRQETKWQALPVIALTANAMQHDIEKYQQLGFDAHIAKPFERSYLLQKTAEVLSRQKPGSKEQ